MKNQCRVLSSLLCLCMSCLCPYMDPLCLLLWDSSLLQELTNLCDDEGKPRWCVIIDLWICQELANLYRLVRVELNSLYELLPTNEREKYYGYFVAVSEYEKKIAEGVYNPDLDGVRTCLFCCCALPSLVAHITCPFDIFYPAG